MKDEAYNEERKMKNEKLFFHRLKDLHHELFYGMHIERRNRVFSRQVAWPVVTMETFEQTNQRTMTAGAQALSAHYIMLIRPVQALPLVRIYRKLSIFKYIF